MYTYPFAIIRWLLPSMKTWRLKYNLMEAHPTVLRSRMDLKQACILYFFRGGGEEGTLLSPLHYRPYMIVRNMAGQERQRYSSEPAFGMKKQTVQTLLPLSTLVGYALPTCLFSGRWFLCYIYAHTNPQLLTVTSRVDDRLPKVAENVTNLYQCQTTWIDFHQ